MHHNVNYIFVCTVTYVQGQIIYFIQFVNMHNCFRILSRMSGHKIVSIPVSNSFSLL